MMLRLMKEGHREYTCRSVARWRPWAAIRRFGGLLNMNKDSRGSARRDKIGKVFQVRINLRSLAVQVFDL